MKQSTNPLRRLTYAGVFAAMICLTTAFILHIPVGNGYIHLGDSVIYLAACLLPAPYAVAAAAIGGGMADLLCGYTVYVIPTMLVKSALAGCFALLRAKHTSAPLTSGRSIAAAVACVPITVIGYWLTACVLYGNPAAQLLETVPANFIQALGSGAAFYLAAFGLDRAKAMLPRL